MARKLLFMYIVIVCWKNVLLLNNGLALRPPMGWMSWGYYECNVDCNKNPDKCLNEELIISVADHMYNDGYLEAGYEYIVIDDCWSEMERDYRGRLVADKKRFPRGMKYLADYIHSKGLKFGMYTNVAPVTCKGYPGSLGHMEADAASFAEWNIDYLKVDGCFVSEDILNRAYTQLGSKLNATGRPIVYSCSWPYYVRFIYNHTPNYEAVSRHCNLWRDFHDIFPHWPNVQWVISHFEKMYESMWRHHGPGHWFDPDMLQVGRNVLTPGQNRIQMSVYAMLSAPLIISCDMKKIPPDESNILLNLDLIAMAQDPLGLMAKPYKITKTLTVWVKLHHPKKADIYPSFSFAVVNMGATRTEVSIVPKDYGVNSTDHYTVYDVFKQQYISNISRSNVLTVTVPYEDVVLYTLYPL